MTRVSALAKSTASYSLVGAESRPDMLAARMAPTHKCWSGLPDTLNFRI